MDLVPLRVYLVGLESIRRQALQNVLTAVQEPLVAIPMQQAVYCAKQVHTHHSWLVPIAKTVLQDYRQS